MLNCAVCGNRFSCHNEYVAWVRNTQKMEGGSITDVNSEVVMSVCSENCAKKVPMIMESPYEDEVCFVCRNPVDREKEHVVWLRQVEKEKGGTVTVLKAEEVVLVCSKKCAKQVRFEFDRKRLHA